MNDDDKKRYRLEMDGFLALPVEMAQHLRPESVMLSIIRYLQSKASQKDVELTNQVLGLLPRIV